MIRFKPQFGSGRNAETQPKITHKVVLIYQPTPNAILAVDAEGRQ
jgi:hypothetical protein